MTPPASILIIDDDAALTDVLQKLLRRHGFIVHIAGNGKQGLKLLATEPADLVITDIFMGEMEGLETIVNLKQKYPATRIIAMSGGSQVVGLDCLTHAKHLGADQTLKKPVEISTLLATIQNLPRTAAGNHRPPP